MTFVFAGKYVERLKNKACPIISPLLFWEVSINKHRS